MGKHYSEASQRAARWLFRLGLGVAVVAVVGALVWQNLLGWMVLCTIAVLAGALALWNRPTSRTVSTAADAGQARQRGEVSEVSAVAGKS